MRTKRKHGREKDVEAARAECAVTWKEDIRINLVGNLSFNCYLWAVTTSS